MKLNRQIELNCPSCNVFQIKLNKIIMISVFSQQYNYFMNYTEWLA